MGVQVNSARRRTLTSSMLALSAGLPGLEKSGLRPREAQNSRSREMNFEAWSTRIVLDSRSAGIPSSNLLANNSGAVAEMGIEPLSTKLAEITSSPS